MQNMTLTSPAVRPVRPVRYKQIALPTEHGGWGLLFEPIVAGIAVAFSFGGLWIATLAIGAFLTRQPLKVFISNRLGMKDEARDRVALSFVALYAVIALVGLVGTLYTAGTGPLVIAAGLLPLMIALVYYDFSLKSRNLFPELAGTISISSSIAMIALASGLPMTTALALWVVMMSRLIPSILYVRNRLKLEKGKEYSKTIPLGAHIIALALVGVLAAFRLTPFLLIPAMLLLAYRAFEGLSQNRRKMKAMKIGVLEIVYGSVTVLALIIGFYSGI